MSVSNMVESDKKKLEAGLEYLKKLNEELSNKYSLRSDLVEMNDRRYALGALLNEELNKIREQQQKLESKTDELSNLKDKLDESFSAIVEIEHLLKEDENGISRYTKMLNITSEENFKDLEKKANEILQIYDSLFTIKEKEISKIDQIKSEIENISLNYEKFFEEEIDDDGRTRIEELDSIYHIYKKYYASFFEASDPRLKSKKDQIDDQLNRIQNFHDKIYGNEAKQILPLEKKLEEQLIHLKEIEKKASAVIELSSDAGLAAGFVVKGKEAKKGQIFSIIVFFVVTAFIFYFNYNLFDKNDFLNLKWDSFVFKLILNAPLIWIATIANINLNKFSRLEQEYSHKEALAKSYERYKTEIQQLEQLDVIGSGELKLKLLEINLEAFKVNPAEHVGKAKADFSIWDIVRNKNLNNKSE